MISCDIQSGEGRTRNFKIWNGSPSSIRNWSECFTTARMILLDLAKLYEEREKIADKTRAIDTTDPANQDGVQSLIDQMLAINLRITTVEGQLRDLEAKIQEKFVKYGIKIEQMTKFGDEIRQSNEMMTGITRASDEFMQELEHWDVWREEIYDNNLP